MTDRERERLDIALGLSSYGRTQELLDIAQWIEDDAADADEPVREYAAAIAARIRGLTTRGNHGRD